MTQESFCQYALSPRLTADEIYTIELLIDRVQSRFDPGYWDNDRARSDERARPNYRPRFLKEHVEPAARELQKINWLSLQRLNRDQHPVRDLTAFKHLQNLSTLVLRDNEVSGLSPLGECPQLRELILSGNPLHDLGPLATCSKLERLDIYGLPARNLTVLQQLPKLQELTLLIRQLPAFKKLQFGARLEDGTDYTIPYKWPGSRSRTIVLYSNQAVENFMELVLGIQRILAHCQNDWIIYFQTDGTEKQFVVWVYPEKVVTTSEYAGVVRDLTSRVV